jgi:hypothetical protein
MNKKALLILVGGRQVPNVLTAQYLKPEIIVPIASHEAMQPGREWSKVEPILRQLCAEPAGFHPPVEVNAYDPRETYRACLEALLLHQDAEWVVNVTCGSKIMGFGAYDAALPNHWPMPVAIWYLDTATRKVVALKGQAPPDFYHLDVEDYFAIYGRQAHAKRPAPEEVAVANLLAQHPSAAMKIAKGWRSATGTGVHRKFFAPPQNLPPLLKALQEAGFIKSFRLSAAAVRPTYGRVSECEIEITKKPLQNFLGGEWLEVYAWGAAMNAGCFEDSGCSVKISAPGASNELDLAATSAATLLMAECKTDAEPFRMEYLNKLDSIASLVGGGAVARVFITSQAPPKDEGGQKSYAAFCEQAKVRQIVVITGEQLHELPKLLSREVGLRPTYSRI